MNPISQILLKHTKLKFELSFLFIFFLSIDFYSYQHLFYAVASSSLLIVNSTSTPGSILIVVISFMSSVVQTKSMTLL